MQRRGLKELQGMSEEGRPSEMQFLATNVPDVSGRWNVVLCSLSHHRNDPQLGVTDLERDPRLLHVP